MTTQPDDIEQRLDEFFEQNYASIRLEGGHGLTPEVRAMARDQVRLYWRKLQDIAQRITDTEVRLNLPQHKTPNGRTFGIDGIVDIVREDEQVVMYDIKTHLAESVEASKAQYKRQLSVYAHIWQNLRGQRLDETAIIATKLPDGLREAMRKGDDKQIARQVDAWQPVVSIPLDAAHVDETIHDFAVVVDCIENGQFAPPDLARLLTRQDGTRGPFATNICRNCDARFSCASYRQYAHQASQGIETRFRQFFDDYGDDATTSERLATGLPDEEETP